MKRQVVIYVTLFLCAIAAEIAANEATASDEALSVRRIIEFWKDHEHDLVKSQVQQFLELYPDSEYAEGLLVILGDTYWLDKQYRSALAAYESVKKPVLQQKIFHNYLDSLYNLKMWETLSTVLTKQMTDSSPDELTDPERQQQTFFFAEAEYRQGAAAEMEEAKDHHLKIAINQYEKLLPTPYKVKALAAIADIHSINGSKQESVNALKELVIELPDQQELLLYRIAALQRDIDPEESLATLSQVQAMEGSLLSEAILSKTALLYEMKRYRELVDGRVEAERGLKSDYKPYYDYLLGRSYALLGDYGEANALLMPLLSMSWKEDSPININRKSLLSAALTAAHHINDLALVENLAASFKAEYPGDEMIAKVLYLAALTNKNNEKYGNAEEIFEQIVKEFSAYDKLENVEYELASLQMMLPNYDKAGELFKAFHAKYPNNPLTKNVLQNIALADSRILEQRQKEGKDVDAILNELSTDLVGLLQRESELEEAERLKYKLKLGKVFYELKRYDEAKKELEEVANTSTDERSAVQAHLLLSMVAYNGFCDNSAFISHTEKVLAINPAIEEADRLHLNLFTAYLQQVKDAEEGSVSASERCQWLDNAAEHLYTAYEHGCRGVKREGISWLAGYYYDKVKERHNDYDVDILDDGVAYNQASRALKLYATLFGDLLEDSELEIAPENVAVEQQLYKFSNVYGWLGDTTKQIAVLKLIAQEQASHPKMNWSLKARVAYSLGCSLEKAGRREQAEELFQTIVTVQDPFIGSASKLHLARLLSAKVTPSNRTLRNGTVLTILKYFKDLQIRKQLMQEPLHLEAAFEYVALRAILEPKEKQWQHELFLTRRLKEDFTATEDLWSKDYHALRRDHPDKESIYRAFMMLADANIARLESLEAFRKGAEAEGELKQQAALSLYRMLLDNSVYNNTFLSANAQKGISQLRQD